MTKILIVEDNPKNLKLAKLLLESNGFNTITATDGKSGIEMAEKNLPDLIIMDIQMPDLDGIEAFKILQQNEQTNQIPVIAATAFAMKGDKEQLLDIGFSSYISKPIRLESFIKSVNEVLKKNEK